MPEYVLRGANRTAEGQLGPTLLEEKIIAPSSREAVQQVNARDFSADDETINKLWLTDESGNLVWSLRPGE